MREDKRHMTMNTIAVFCTFCVDISIHRATFVPDAGVAAIKSNKRLPSCYRVHLAALGVRVVGEVSQCLVP